MSTCPCRSPREQPMGHAPLQLSLTARPSQLNQVGRLCCGPSHPQMRNMKHGEVMELPRNPTRKHQGWELSSGSLVTGAQPRKGQRHISIISKM